MFSTAIIYQLDSEIRAWRESDPDYWKKLDVNPPWEINTNKTETPIQLPTAADLFELYGWVAGEVEDIEELTT